MPRRPWILAAGFVFLAVLIHAGAGSGQLRHAAACAFDPLIPETYEADAGRAAYVRAIEAASQDALFPNDARFALPTVESGTRQSRVDGVASLPAELLKAIAWVESDMTMASRSVRFRSLGDALVTFDCGHGMMQVTSGMTTPDGDGRASDAQVLIATSYLHNAASGAAILVEKWNQAPQSRPIVGTDTGGTPILIENWYYAVWSYNGFTGPGATNSNHPLDPSKAFPRADYRCDGTQSRSRYPYQELVWGCLQHPPTREGALVWSPLAATLPDLTLPQFFAPLAPGNFTAPYAGMDMPTPQPAHTMVVPDVAPGFPASALGSPALDADTATLRIRVGGLPEEARATLEIRNRGSGLLAWQASSDDGFLVLDPPAGVALGADVLCTEATCRDGTLTVTVNPTLLPRARATATIRITSPNAPRTPILVQVEVSADFELGVPGTSNAR